MKTLQLYFCTVSFQMHVCAWRHGRGMVGNKTWRFFAFQFCPDQGLPLWWLLTSVHSPHWMLEKHQSTDVLPLTEVRKLQLCLQENLTVAGYGENQEVWKTDRATQLFMYVCLFSVANNHLCSAAPHCSKEEHIIRRGIPSMYGICIDQIVLLPGLCHKGKGLCSCKYRCYSAHGQHGS